MKIGDIAFCIQSGSDFAGNIIRKNHGYEIMEVIINNFSEVNGEICNAGFLVRRFGTKKVLNYIWNSNRFEACANTIARS